MLEKTQKKADWPQWKFSYAISVALAMSAVFATHLSLQWRQTNLPISIFWLEVAIAAALVVSIFISIVRKKHSTVWWEVMLLLLAFVGVWIFMLALLPVWLAVMIAGALIVFSFLFQRIGINGLLFLLGSTGVGLLMALQFAFEVMFLCSLGFLLYDILRSKEVRLATLFSEAWLVGTPPGLLIPAHLRDWSKKVLDVWKPGRGQIVGLLPFMILTGMGFHLIAWNIWLAVAYTVIVLGIGLVFGQTKQGYLRAWVFLAAGVASYFIYGMIRMFV